MKNTKKGFTPIMIIILVVLGITVLGTGVYFVNKQSKPVSYEATVDTTDSSNAEATSTVTATTTPTTGANNQTPSIQVTLPDGKEIFPLNDDGFFEIRFTWKSNVALTNTRVFIQSYDFIRAYNKEEAPIMVSRILPSGNKNGSGALTTKDLVRGAPLLQPNANYIVTVCGYVQNTTKQICDESSTFRMSYSSDLLSINVGSPSAESVWLVDSMNRISWRAQGIKKVNVYLEAYGPGSNGYVSLLNEDGPINANIEYWDWYSNPIDIPLRDGTTYYYLADETKLFAQYRIRVDEADGLNEDNSPVIHSYSAPFVIKR